MDIVIYTSAPEVVREEDVRAALEDAGFFVGDITIVARRA